MLARMAHSLRQSQRNEADNQLWGETLLYTTRGILLQPPSRPETDLVVPEATGPDVPAGRPLRCLPPFCRGRGKKYVQSSSSPQQQGTNSEKSCIVGTFSPVQPWCWGRIAADFSMQAGSGALLRQGSET